MEPASMPVTRRFKSPLRISFISVVSFISIMYSQLSARNGRARHPREVRPANGLPHELTDIDTNTCAHIDPELIPTLTTTLRSH